MLSTLSLADSLPDVGKGIGYSNVFTSSQGEFTPWENLESFFVGLDDPNLKSLLFDEESSEASFGSNDQNQNSSSSHDYEASQIRAIIDERKLKRMASNRESARKSRKRKQTQMEDLTNEVTRFKAENEEGRNRLRLTSHNVGYITSENNRLRVESVVLQRRLIQLNQISQLQQTHRSNINHDHQIILHPHHYAYPC